MTKYEKPEPLYVKWVDSANLFEDRWARPEDLDAHDEVTFCETVGWLVAENEWALYVAGSLSPEEIGSVMQIPRVAVVKRVPVLLASTVAADVVAELHASPTAVAMFS